MNQSQSWIHETQLNFEHYKSPNFKLNTHLLIKTPQFRVHSKMAETAVFHLLANFASFLQQEAHLLTGVQNEIEYIRDEFDHMMSFLRVADAIEENDPELKVWVNQVREAAYDIGDVLDLFMLRLGHRHGHGF
ncbi:Disease resistance protein PIK6-NP [Camellia lanceoleosa]|uniref:Disease resistance protein PIK6-NP n=1 Tax=Camellia lanceoleosa TaxID=1840588 RepID=A0ACC0HGZ1_9ERIC|nr:Disease resistance protein PIK6-NP [Camellia lanceoleosa]